MIVEKADLIRLMDACQKSAFRLETLPQYLVPDEEQDLADWRAGTLKPRTPEDDEWLAELQEITARGIRWYRVHILDFPLCDYSRFEVASYRETDAAGQETFLADRAEHAELADLHQDFWLLDDEIAVRMIYDEEGHYLHPERDDDVDKYRRIRDVALRCAEPLETFLKRRNPKLTP